MRTADFLPQPFFLFTPGGGWGCGWVKYYFQVLISIMCSFFMCSFFYPHQVGVVVSLFILSINVVEP